MKGITKYISVYLGPKVIFVIDTVIAVVSAVIVLLILNLLSGSAAYTGSFAIWWLGGTTVFSTIVTVIFRTYNVIVRHATLKDIRTYVSAVLIANILLGSLLAVIGFFDKTIFFALFANFLQTVVLAISARFLMVDMYEYFKSRNNSIAHRQRILVYGTSEKSVAAISRFGDSIHYQLIGFISHNSNEKNLLLAGYPVLAYKSESDFKKIVENYSLHAVLFATDKDVQTEESGLIRYCTHHNVRALIIPSVDEVLDGKVMKGGIRQVKIEDLLGRPEIKISMDEIRQNFQGKVVMVTGAAGSIGSELCRQLATFGIRHLVLYDNAETPMHNLRLELEARFPQLDFVPVIGSVRHKDRLDYAFRNFQPQIVFHAAAYKHVPLMEENPCEAVFANVYGTRMVADKCVQYDVEMMVMISTDKAVNPTNVMGCSKRIAEIYVQSLGLALAKGEVHGKTKFVTTRFGNVLGSNGSVIPRFRQQIENGGPVTVTHPDITRFFMTIPEACRLVMEAATLPTENRICVFDMGTPVKIDSLARRMIELSGLVPDKDIQVTYTGLRPGEKLYEEVLSTVENTDPTSHDRIRIAHVRTYEYADAKAATEKLETLSRAVEIPEMVRYMKQVVPEYKSNNSKFEAYDAR